ncbi:MAG: sulfatase [Gemmatimonadota bacterium]|jgi:arylsulfatase A-like enzyme
MEILPVLVSLKGGGLIRLSRDFLWMTPLGDVIIFLLAALAILAAGRIWPSATHRPLVMSLFAGMTTMAVALCAERLYAVAVLLLAVGVGVQVGRRTRGPIRNRRILGASTAVALILVVVLAGRVELRDRSIHQYWLSRLPSPKGEAPNVVLLILDTVRGASLDFLPDLRQQSAVKPVRTPALEALARESVIFTRAIAPSPWTLPSHGSMFTGHWANRLSGAYGPGTEGSRGLDLGMTTLAQVLRDDGYLTAGFVGNLLYAFSDTGLGLGFLTYEDYEKAPAQIFLSTSMGRRLARTDWLRGALGHHEVLNRKGARTVMDQFLDWQEGNHDRPFFAFLNLFDAHEPYFPPDSVKNTMPSGSRWDDFTHYVGVVVGASAVRTDKWDMDRAERGAHAAGYNATITRMDSEIQRMLEEMARRGVLENTVLIVAGDHGEQLGEHGLYGHSNSLYLPALHVPLMVYDGRKNGEQRVVRSVVSLRDMAATILDLAGVDAAPAGIEGSSLARYWTQPNGELVDSSGPASETAFSVLYRGSMTEAWYPVERGPAMYSLVDSVYHYILNGDGTEELFDLRSDPGEVSNLAGEPSHGDVLEGFREKLVEFAPEVLGGSE